MSQEYEVTARDTQFMPCARSVASYSRSARVFPMSDEAILSLEYEVVIKAHTANYQRMYEVHPISRPNTWFTECAELHSISRAST